MNKNEFALLHEVKKQGMDGVRALAKKTGLSLGFVSRNLKQFTVDGLVDGDGITEKGLVALKPYKVKCAIIMAAGMSSRFVPISLERPKGLMKVKGEVLIERQIRQLREAGIDKIVVVLGYKKESFFYLEDKMNVKVIINPLYNVKNNIETLYLAREYFGNCYICSSDNYFSENVFEEYVYRSYYASVYVSEKSNEWYMIPDANMNVAKVKMSGDDGYIMLGHVYWDEEFAAKFEKLMEYHREIGDYDAFLWEKLFSDNIKSLPPMNIRPYAKDVIHEFDSLEELREFDADYIYNSDSGIMKNICSVFSCNENDIVGFAPIKKGLTNSSFVFEVFGKKYVYRHPGENTESIISRRNEEISLKMAKKIGIDPTFIVMDPVRGWKISRFVPDVRTPDYSCFEDSERVISVMRKLHEREESVDWEFLPWEEACKIEDLLRKTAEGIQIEDFDELKKAVQLCFESVKDDGVKKCFCHCDTYAPNWMLTDTDTILIDWEYAGNADPGCDVGGYIMDASYPVEEGRKFIEYYCGDGEEKRVDHFMAYVAIISYYWFVWALFRESSGAVMGESLHKWYVMAKKYSNYLIEKKRGEKPNE